MSDVIEFKGQYYIRANASIADASTRVLKHADTFGVFDRHGDVRPLGFENQGVFHEGTRFLSRWKLTINGGSPLLLSSTVKEDNDFLIVDMTNSPSPGADGQSVSQGTIHVVRTIFLWEGSFFEQTEISNFALAPVSLSLGFEFGADYVDLFELRGQTRQRRGELRSPSIVRDQVTFSYKGLDELVRQTRFQFNVTPHELSPEHAVFKVDLEPQERKLVESRAVFFYGDEQRSQQDFSGAVNNVTAAFEDYQKGLPKIETSNPQFNDWINQSRADLHMLITRTAQGPYPYAGIPWFSCIFGRDGIITALETLWIYPDIARGVLGYLASRQASQSIPAQDADPGKILHEERKGEMVALNEIPFGCYYGSIDSTPLWLMLAGRYFERTGDREFMTQMWPHVGRALAWIDSHGDCDGDGFVEYSRRASGGLSNQGWKDADDSVFHADGTMPEAPIALCEVQGYVYEAKLRAAEIAEAIGCREDAGLLRDAAERLKAKFHSQYWCDEIQSYAIALDGRKQPCRIRSSNAGQCLFTGIATPEAAALIKNNLLSDCFFSGWGVRTIPTTEARYNPMSYHDGSIWPHDNALIAAGLARYGFKEAALKILNALFDASHFMELNRLPELYCGFQRRHGEGPTLYPVACNPQAWSSAAVFFLLQACLGLRVDISTDRLYFEDPRLPMTVDELKITNLKVGYTTLDILLVRQDNSVSVTVPRRTGKTEVIVIH